MTYLCSTPYTPVMERTVHPLDPALGLPWPPDVQPALSDKDAAAPTLAEAASAGILPTWDACRARYAELRAGRSPARGGDAPEAAGHEPEA